MRSVNLVLFILALLVTSPVHAQADDWRKEMGTFRIGVVVGNGSRQLDGADMVRRSFSNALGMPVEIFAARDALALIDAQAAGRIEYAVYSALSFATAVRYCNCVEPLVAPISLTGATALRSIIIERKSAADTRTLAVYRPDAASPATALLSGLPEEQYTTRLFPDEEAALAAFAAGQVDALMGHILSSDKGDLDDSGTIGMLAGKGMDTEELVIASRGHQISFGPHAVISGLPGEAKSILRSFLTAVIEQQPEIADILSPEWQGGFRLVQPIDYAGASAALDAILAGKKETPVD